MSKENNELTKLPKKTERVIRDLINANFELLFEDGKDKEELFRFKNFLSRRAVPNKGFLIAYLLTDNKHGYFFYEINHVKTDDKRVSAFICYEVFILEGNLTVDLPEEYKKYPIWWLSGKKIGQKN